MADLNYIVAQLFTDDDRHSISVVCYSIVVERISFYVSRLSAFPFCFLHAGNINASASSWVLPVSVPMLRVASRRS